MQESLVRLKREVKTHFLTGTTWWQARQLRHVTPRPRTAILLGDSRARSWPRPHIDGLHFFNRGIGYDTSTRLLRRAARHVIALRPELIIIQIGVNDFQPLMRHPEELGAIVKQTQEEIRRTVGLLRRRDCHVLLTTIFPVANEAADRKSSGYWGIDQKSAEAIVASAIESTNAYIGTLAGDGVRILDAHQILRGDDGFTQPNYALDALHINQVGYQALNTAIETMGSILV